MIKHDTGHSAPLSLSKQRTFTSLIRWLKRVIAIGLLLGTVVIGLGLFIFLRSFSSLQSQENKVFISVDKSGQMVQIHLAEFNFSQPELVVSQVSFSKDILKEMPIFTELQNPANQQTQNQQIMAMSLVLERVVNEIVIVEADQISITSKHELLNMYWQLFHQSQGLEKKWSWFREYWRIWNELPTKSISFGDDFSSKDDWERQRPLAFMTPEVARHCPVAFVNTTTTGGLASELTELSENSGAEVVRVTDTETDLDQTYLFTDTPEACEPVVKLIKALLPSSLPLAENQDVTSRYRAHLVVLIGKDVAEVYGE